MCAVRSESVATSSRERRARLMGGGLRFTKIKENSRRRGRADICRYN